MKKTILFLALLFLPGFVFSEERSTKLTISPHTVEIKLERGETYSGKIKILNKSDFPVPIIVKVTDFSAEDETGEMLVKDSSENIGTWFSFKKKDFILDSEESETVEFDLKVPETAELGGYYEIVLFEPQFPVHYFDQDKPRVIPSIGTIFLISVGEKKTVNPFVVSEFSIPKEIRLEELEDGIRTVFGLISSASADQMNKLSVVSSADLTFFLKIKNNDFYHVKPEGRLEIFSLTNRKIGEAEIEKITVLPGKSRKFPVEFSPELPQFLESLPLVTRNFILKNLFWGKYRAKLFLESNGQTLTEETTFWVFPWRTAVVLICSLSVVIFLRKRLIQSLKVITAKKRN